MLTSAHNNNLNLNHHLHHLHLPQSPAIMPVAASPCSTSSSSLGFHQPSMSSSVSDLLNLSNSSFGESSTSSVQSSPKRHEQTSSSVPRVRTVRLKRPSIQVPATTSTAAAQVAAASANVGQQSRNLLIGGSAGTASRELSGIVASNSSLFGFSIRGGSEYRTGFFVSHVEPAGEADVQGVQVGDQIIRVNNHPVDDATHKELSQYIANQSHLTLRVRNIGMIPVKDRDQDPLTWQMVHQDQKSSSSSDYDDVIQCKDILITLSLGPKEKLGLGICKGPEWKPGIFVQFTKDHGIARRAGLKPGDQILSCNGVEFQDIFFNDAVTVMKASSHLELIVRTAVGLELFPGESSGYNSSASSVTGGDQSPCWNEPGGAARRYDMESRMNVSKLKSPFKPKSSSGHRDRLMAVNSPKVPHLATFQNSPAQPLLSQMKGPRPHETIARATAVQDPSPNQNTTIIKLSQEGTIINNTLIPNVSNFANHPSPLHKLTAMGHGRSATMVRVQSLGDGIDSCGMEQRPVNNEQRTVIVEVHRGNSNHSSNKSIPPPPPPIAKGSNMGNLRDINSAAPVIPSIADEIKRRAESLQQRKPESSSSIDDRLQMKAKANGLVTADQHNQLMDEFKKAHQKMFKNGENRSLDEDLERQRAQQLRNNEIDRDHPDTFTQAPPPPTTAPVQNVTQSKTLAKNHYLTRGKSSPSPPPPPPPEPGFILSTSGENHQHSEAEISPPIEFADDAPKKTTFSKRPAPDNSRHNGHRGIQMEKPLTPTPDYDSLIYNNSTEHNPVSAIPPPPPPMHGLAAAAKGHAPPKPNRSISVTIGEYDSKKEPSKLGFLNRANSAFGGGASTSEMLQNELQMTLSRSNLKKSADVPKNGSQNGVPGVTKSVLEKTGNANIERLTSRLNSRNASISGTNKITSNGTKKVTISIPKTKAAEPEGKSSPNGILKTANGGSVTSFNGGNGSGGGGVGDGVSGVSTTNGEVKNIKFDNITTVIGIRK